MTKSTVVRGMVVVALSVAASGCGSSDSPLGQSGRLVQGPVLGATVYADSVTTGTRFALEGHEVSTVTDSQTGNFTFPVAPGYSYVLVSKGGTDKITGQPAIQLMAPAGSANITPLTTLVALDTTGAVKQKLEALLPAGAKFDADISTTVSPAALLVAKSVEVMVQTMSNAISQKAGNSAISAAQISAIQAQTMQAIAGELAQPGVTATTLAAPATLASSLQSAASSAATNIAGANSNITVPDATAQTIASSAVTACSSALGVGNSASTNAISGGEAAALSSTAGALVTAMTTATTAASSTITASATPVSYTPPTIPVVVPTNPTGTTGGSTGGTGTNF